MTCVTPSRKISFFQGQPKNPAKNWWQPIHTWQSWRRNLNKLIFFIFFLWEKRFGGFFSFFHKQVLGSVPHTESPKSISNWVKCLQWWKINKALLIFHYVGVHITITLSVSKLFGGQHFFGVRRRKYFGILTLRDQLILSAQYKWRTTSTTLFLLPTRKSLQLNSWTRFQFIILFC